MDTIISQQHTRRVDIIGAGISGLATAYYLAQTFRQDAGQPNRVQIHVWEKDAAPGGLAGIFSTPDFTVEKFYHHIFRRDLALQNLLAELHLADDLIWKPADTGAYYFRQPYRLSSPLDLLRFTPLSFIDRFRLGWLAIHARTVRDWRTLDDISAKEYIIKVAGANVYRVVWEPLFHGKFGAESEQISAAWLWSKLVDRGGSRNRQGHEMLGYLRGGLGRMFTAMIEQLQSMGHVVHTGQAVQRFEGTTDRIETIITDTGAFPADVVIGCAQLPDLADMLPERAHEYSAALRQIRFLANVCLVLTLKKSLSQFYWTNVTEANAPFVGIIEQTNWADRRDFNHKHLVYLSAYVTPDDPRLTMNAEELVNWYLPAIKHMFPEFSAEHIEGQAVWNTPYAQPVVHVGYRRHIPQIASPLANFFVCTMAQIYPHDRQISNGIEFARKTAELVAQSLQ